MGTYIRLGEGYMFLKLCMGTYVHTSEREVHVILKKVMHERTRTR